MFCRFQTLDVDLALRFEQEIVLQGLLDAFCDLNAARRAMAFHAARHIHGISPDVEEQLAVPYDARHGRSGMLQVDQKLRAVRAW